MVSENTDSAGQVEETTPPSDSEPQDTEPSVDLEALREQIAGAGEQAATKADLEVIKRATGHIPGLQKRLDSLEKALTRVDKVEAAVSRLDALLDALPEGFLTDRQLADLRPRSDDGTAELRDKIAELESKLTGQPQDEQPIDPALAARMAQWQAADAQVMAYASDKKFEITPEDPAWERALQKFPNDPTMAALEVIKHIDGEIAAKARREEKAEAGSGGNGGRSARTGTLTLARMKEMSVDELRAIPIEERNAALAAG